MRTIPDMTSSRDKANPPPPTTRPAAGTSGRHAAPDPSPKVSVQVDGITTEVLEIDVVLYVGTSYNLEGNSVKAALTTDRESCWTALRGYLAKGAGQYGHVVAYNIIRKEEPTRIRCLGRIDTPTMEPVLS